MKINLIVAVGNNNVIGNNGQMLWSIPEDLKRFKTLTEHKPVIMGRKTYESIGAPLENRLNFVVSSGDPIEGCIVMKDPRTIFDLTFDEVFVIGGQQMYEYFLAFADTIYVTYVFEDYEGDTFFPDIDLSQWDEMYYQDGTNTDDAGPQWGYSKFVRSQF